jgi:hypothetical protein
MKSRKLLLSVLVACLALTAACGSDTTSTNSPTAPTTPQVSVTFNGTLTVNGAASYPFTTSGSGPVVATLTSLATTSTGTTVLTAVSLSLGTWNGATCSITIANDAAFQGSSASGTSSTGGSFCVRISDVGTLTESATYTITVTHY